MEKYEEIGLHIQAFLSGLAQPRTHFAHTGSARFVVCGTSGSGKTRAVKVANDLLGPDEQIAESQDLLRVKTDLHALEIIYDAELKYERSKHIGFNVLSSCLAKDLEAKGVKVFWLDKGIQSTT